MAETSLDPYNFKPCAMDYSLWEQMCTKFLHLFFNSHQNIPVAHALSFLEICVKLSSSQERCNLVFCPVYNKCDVSENQIAWGSKIKGRMKQDKAKILPSDSIRFGDSASFVVISKNEES